MFSRHKRSLNPSCKEMANPAAPSGVPRGSGQSIRWEGGASGVRQSSRPINILYGRDMGTVWEIFHVFFGTILLEGEKKDVKIVNK
ncbi:hypothetical protein E2C01_101551 [Portunus trituberculatus]|uniref:Uncharacterized protein n=1 Tax=Portunus trituberculatus TaxID=210409 RepID=A0A5B7KG05_PORTR|nr:hypothetical protein [Portunus trituberculatus]